MANTATSPTSEQQAVIDHWGSGMAVLAGAGSGKTTTLVKKCLSLLDRKPDARFIAVSFTERSAGDLREKLSKAFVERGDPSALNHHWVTTIHGLCGSVLKEFPREAGFDGEESILPENEALALWERAIETLWYDEISDSLEKDLETLLNRETRSSLLLLLQRVRELVPFGVLRSFSGSVDPEAKALERISSYIIEKYQSLKQRLGVLDFSDLEKGANRALEHESVRKAYHSRFALLLIDEFQDTNPVQAGILWRMGKPDLSNICVVGDPKQSIYRFRDADVSIFQEYCAQLPTHFSLTWNFRSRPKIIDYVNRVCEKVFENSEIPFEALVPKRAETSEENVLRLDLTQPFELARWILEENKKGVPLQEMALLVRRIRGNELWFKALESSGVPIAIGSGGLFWESPRVRELVSFLKWWDNPANSLSGAVFLRAPWTQQLDGNSLSDQVLDQWANQKQNLLECFIKSEHPLAKRLAPLRAVTVRPAELLGALAEEASLFADMGSSLLGLWHRLEQLSSQGLDFHSVVQEVARAVEEGRRERDIPAPKTQGQLSILTLHGSKGLEFRNVILLDFGPKTRASDAPLLFWDRTQGAYLAKRDEQGQREKKSQVENSWRELERRKNLAESKRLFYVGLTRAQERLILVCPQMEDPFEKVDRQKVYQEDYWRGWVESAGNPPSVQVSALAEKAQARKIQTVPTLRAKPSLLKVKTVRARHSVTEWVLLSRCKRAYEWTYLLPKEVSTEPKEATVLSASEIGSRIHLILEKGDLSQAEALEKEVGSSRFLAAPLIQWAKAHSGWIHSDPQAGRSVFSELSFEVPIQNDVLVGVMDRVIFHQPKEGLPSADLVDFKFSDRPVSTWALVDSYRAQTDLYSWALTQLEPQLRMDRIRATLVSISPEGVKMVGVPNAAHRLDPQRLLEKAQALIDGRTGEPQPGKQCRYCSFLKLCPDGLEKTSEKQDSDASLRAIVDFEQAGSEIST
ncbi:MAG: ATP-dependent helicase [Bdellovibrio sp.]|nr:ATP-dependent helicase [Bdellovibrio sp.]